MTTFLNRFQRRSIFLFVILFAVTLPFPLSFFPSPGESLQGFFLQWNHWSAVHLFGIKPGIGLLIESDSPGFYIHLFHLLLFSLLFGWLWTAFSKGADEERLKYSLNAAATYILAFFLLKYGFDKIFKVQFYLPEPNTLYTPLGFLSKDILFWSTVGSSYSYSVFSGLMEVLPAFLLFSRKTRLLGGLIAIGVMLHVLVINFSFEISVKILSAYLLLLSVIVIWPYFSALSGIFFSGKSAFTRPEMEKVNLNKGRKMRFLKALVFAAMLFECLFTYVEKNQFNDDLAPRPKFHGAYELIDRNAGSGLQPSREKSIYFGDLSLVKRIFIHRRGYLIFQFEDESMQDYPAIYGDAFNEITVKTSNELVLMKIEVDSKTSGYTFVWEENGKQFRLIAKLLPLYPYWNVDRK